MTHTQVITFVTSNAGKVATARTHLQPLGVTVEQAVLDLDEIQSFSVQTVALHKAQQAFRTLRRPLIVEDSGFYIDELDGFPGPFVKLVIQSLGAQGIARIADLTKTRSAHFEGVLVYMDSHGVPRVFVDRGDSGHIAPEPTTDPQPGSWSALWDVFIPSGGDKPLSSLRAKERDQIFDSWAQHSVFARFGKWLRHKQAATSREAQDGARLRSGELAFEFPPERIAARPRQDGSDRLLVLDRHRQTIEHRRFTDLPNLLPSGSLIVVNNSMVVKAALRRVPDDGTYLHVVSPFEPTLDRVICLCPWKPTVGSSIRVNGGRYVVERIPEAGRDLRQGRLLPDDPSATSLQAFMAHHGDVPIPIYVNAQRQPDSADVVDYQNVYASQPGSVACATAGLHLSKPLLANLRQAGHEIVEVTLHIGYGTWKSLATEYVDEHDMDAEYCEIPAETLQLVRRAKHSGRPVVAVGTSSVRTLETFAENILGSDPIRALAAETKLYISPPFAFRLVDHLVTNFAYPQTPIMALTAAFAGSQQLLFKAYKAAVEHPDYQFFSYGDGTLLL